MQKPVMSNGFLRKRGGEDHAFVVFSRIYYGRAYADDVGITYVLLSAFAGRRDRLLHTGPGRLRCQGRCLY